MTAGFYLPGQGISGQSGGLLFVNGKEKAQMAVRKTRSGTVGRKKISVPGNMMGDMPENADIAYIRGIVLKMLRKIEGQIDGGEEEAERCDRLFGSKGSLADTLALMVELALRLMPQAEAAATGSGAQIVVGEKDRKLVEAFLQRCAVQGAEKP